MKKKFQHKRKWPGETTRSNHMPINWTVQENMDKMLKGYNLSRPSQEDIENMKRPITSTKINSAVEKIELTQINSIKHLKKS